MSLRSKTFKGLAILLGVVVLVYCLATLAGYYLPALVQTRLIPPLLARLDIPAGLDDIRRIGLTGADLTGLRLGDPHNPALTLAALHLDYSLPGLMDRKIERVTLTGLELHAQITDGTLGLRGIDIRELMPPANTEGAPAAPTADTRPRPAIGRIDIRNAALSCRWQGSAFRLPFEMDILSQPANPQVFEGRIRFLARGQPVRIRAEIDLERGFLDLELHSLGIELIRFADLIGRVPGLTLAGRAAVTARTRLQVGPFKLAAARLDLEVQNGGLEMTPLACRLASPDTPEAYTWGLALELTPEDTWHLAADPIIVTRPWPVHIDGFEGTLALSPGGFTHQSAFTATILPAATDSDDQPAGLKTPLVLPLELQMAFSESGRIEYNLNTSPSAPKKSAQAPFQVALGALQLGAGWPHMEISGHRTPSGILARYNLKIPAVGLSAGPDFRGRMQQISLQGKLDAKFAEAQPSVGTTFEIRTARPHLKLQTADITAGKISLAGDLSGNSVGDLQMQATVTTTAAAITDQARGIAISGLDAMLPLSWPLTAKAPAGHVRVKSASYARKDLGSLKAELQQREGRLAFEGSHVNHLLPGLTVAFDGSAEPSGRGVDLWAQARIDDFRPATPLDLGKFLPAAKGIQMTGKADLKLDLDMTPGGARIALATRLKGGSLTMAEPAVQVEGLQLALQIPDLMALRSAPRQTLRFDRLSVGELWWTDGQVDFQIEAPDVLFIEKGEFKWCQGRVYTPAMRLTPDVEDIDVTLFCDRLNLAQVLEQFGAFQSEGRGSVNGRIPLRYHRGRFSFADGFLYSTPGEGGTIRLQGTDILMQGIPPDTPQFAQIDLAREALKDYNYQWAKLNLNTEDEALKIKLQFDGKPTGPLPFVYKKDVGAFMRVDAGSKGSKFQGIRLDVNFSLPLNRLLHFGKSIKDLSDWM